MEIVTKALLDAETRLASKRGRASPQNRTTNYLGFSARKGGGTAGNYAPRSLVDPRTIVGISTLETFEILEILEICVPRQTHGTSGTLKIISSILGDGKVGHTTNDC